jgi:hypothetical protein
MEHIGRWVRAERERRFPNLEFGIAVLSTGAFGPALVMMGFPQMALLRYVGLTLVLGVFWLPLLYRVRKNRYHPNLQTLITAHRQGHLAKALGPHADGLDTAARDLDQISLLTDKAPMPKELRKALRKEASRQMGEAVDLCVGAPALHGVTTEEAPRRVEANIIWMASARSALEKMVLHRPDEAIADPLERLREMVTERETAYAELKA